MIIFHYLTKKIGLTLLALTAFLSIVILANQLIWLLNLAVAGKIPPSEIPTFMLIEAPIIIHLVLPLGLLLAMCIVYSQLNAESELTALFASGLSPKSLLKHSLSITAILALATLIFVMWVRPEMIDKRIKLMHFPSIENLIKTLQAKRFKNLNYADEILYVDNINAAHTYAKGIFWGKYDDQIKSWVLFNAKKAGLSGREEEKKLSLEDGFYFKGMPGQGNPSSGAFKKLSYILPSNPENTHQDIRALSPSAFRPLFGLPPKLSGELQWRLSIPIMMLILSVIAVGLTSIKGRRDKYRVVIPAVFIFIVYSHTLFLCRNWIIEGKIPTWLGMWWVHLIFASLGVCLYRLNHCRN